MLAAAAAAAAPHGAGGTQQLPSDATPPQVGLFTAS